ncbi:MAG: hypothetical protein WCR16_04695 [Bacilli bacterium]
MNELEKKLEEKRIESGLSVANFAKDKLGITFVTYKSFLRNPESSQIVTMNKVSSYLGIGNLELIDMSKKEV